MKFFEEIFVYIIICKDNDDRDDRDDEKANAMFDAD